MRRVALLYLAIVLALPLSAQIKLSDQAWISLLTCSPSEEAIFTVYGHTAIRVCDPAANMDAVFNYGMFDFSKPNFIYRFAKGETDYRLAVAHFKRFLADYAMRGSSVTEQVLNLLPEERARIWEALVINAEPENAVYRYNFFYDNCATRPVAIVEKYVEGEVVYNHQPKPQTFRQLINDCARNKPWLIFGTELALGSPTDKIATPHEELFLPLYLEAAFDKATVKSPDGTERKLVSQTNILAEEVPEEIEKEFFTPLVCSLLFLAVMLLLTWLEWRKKSYYRWLDCLLFLIAGIAGVIIFFLAFVSEHPATWPNWLVLWLHPFHLAAVVLFAVKKFNKAAYYYHFINFAALTLMLLGWYFIPQHLNTAFIFLVAGFWLRSAVYLRREKVKKALKQENK
ncbi:hypothetical protein M2459_003268 [Parabacteroides sp. PF5-5]|uniref:lipoprotein N-acyltransferase Lnb domain-containing protein n=1 Tax=unclassified Parabacteroides TaxID=2649774 RepID=UPI002475164C|nr:MULTISPECIES: DUF4105 domain-containing protein [unclassified Parabacteroides]MDH6306543.1 hypothetical protein [Parabacteroides sp. PH5-39]MDH6317510.1 hypothetical protein [Parabacteroides sp. PF5-13]MDH6321254.1 hypothetical protein [Parabacteroides sp. PH5-13]MDH6324986.1 hypothetical protein [Parabacteroides sp. PH5-8]MDH6328695.1 hypothetical protein [Parabacteroides sp. PH5-41]